MPADFNVINTTLGFSGHVTLYICFCEIDFYVEYEEDDRSDIKVFIGDCDYELEKIVLLNMCDISGKTLMKAIEDEQSRFFKWYMDNKWEQPEGE